MVFIYDMCAKIANYCRLAIYRICIALDRIPVPVQGAATCTDQWFMAVSWYDQRSDPFKPCHTFQLHRSKMYL